jgi:6-phosphogluconate dehydrogenase (decarboxylating)
MASAGKAHIGLIGLAVMGQNLALNIAEKGFDISVWSAPRGTPNRVRCRTHRAADTELAFLCLPLQEPLLREDRRHSGALQQGGEVRR